MQVREFSLRPDSFAKVAELGQRAQSAGLAIGVVDAVVDVELYTPVFIEDQHASAIQEYFLGVGWQAIGYGDAQRGNFLRRESENLDVIGDGFAQGKAILCNAQTRADTLNTGISFAPPGICRRTSSLSESIELLQFWAKIEGRLGSDFDKRSAKRCVSQSQHSIFLATGAWKHPPTQSSTSACV